MNHARAEAPEKFKPGWRLLCAFASIAIVNLACALDATIISVALPVSMLDLMLAHLLLGEAETFQIITVALHGDGIQAFWAGTSFLLTSMVWQPNFVTFSHSWGRRPLLVIALTLFAVGSVVCATARSFTALLAGRSVQGTGVGGTLALTEILMTDMVPLRERGNYFALIGIVWAIGSVAGPLVGGALATKDAWRWIFYLNLPIIAVGFIGIMLFLRLEKRNRTWKEKLLHIDYIGSVIFLASTTSFLMGITWGGVMYAWNSWRTLTPIVLGVFGLCLFVYWETKFPEYSLLPLSIFKNRDSNIAYLLVFMQGIILWAILYYMPLLFEGAKDFTPVFAGISALPQSLTVVPCAMIVGIVAGKTGFYRWALWGGWVLTTLGSGILYLIGPTTSTQGWVFIMLVSGIGIGLLFPALALAIQASAPPKHIAIAAAMFTFFRCFGQTIGVAIGGVIFQNRMATITAGYPLLADSATAYSLDVVALIRQIHSLSNADPRKDILEDALSRSIHTIWALICGLSGISLISAFFIRHHDLNQALATEQAFEGETVGSYLAGTESGA